MFACLEVPPRSWSRHSSGHDQGRTARPDRAKDPPLKALPSGGKAPGVWHVSGYNGRTAVGAPRARL